MTFRYIRSRAVGLTATSAALLLAAAPVLATTLTSESAFKPLGTFSLPTIIGRVIAALLGMVGIISLVMFIYGGVMWMTSAGNQERVTKAKNTVVWAAIGLAVTLGAGSLVRFVLLTLGV